METFTKQEVEKVKQFLAALETISPPICSEFRLLADRLDNNSRKSKEDKEDFGISKVDEKDLALTLRTHAQRIETTYSKTRRNKLFDKSIKAVYEKRLELLVNLELKADRLLVQKFIEVYEDHFRVESSVVKRPNYIPSRDDYRIKAIWQNLNKINNWGLSAALPKKMIEDMLGGPKATLDYGNGKQGKVASAVQALIQAAKATIYDYSGEDVDLSEEALKVVVFAPEQKYYMEPDEGRVNDFKRQLKVDQHLKKETPEWCEEF